MATLVLGCFVISCHFQAGTEHPPSPPPQVSRSEGRVITLRIVKSDIPTAREAVEQTLVYTKT